MSASIGVRTDCLKLLARERHDFLVYRPDRDGRQNGRLDIHRRASGDGAGRSGDRNRAQSERCCQSASSDRRHTYVRRGPSDGISNVLRAVIGICTGSREGLECAQKQGRIGWCYSD